MKTKINFKTSESRTEKRRIGCLDVKTGKVTNAKDDIVRDIDEIEQYDDVGYFGTHENGVLVQKSGKFGG